MDNKKYLFTFEWTKGCVNDYIRKFLKENKVDYFYSFQRIVADLYGIGQYFKFDYEHISGNTYGITATKTENI